MKSCFYYLFFSIYLYSLAMQAQSPVTFSANFYNPCGGDGSNEFLTGYVSGPGSFDPTKLYYFVSGVGTDSIYQDAFCSSAMATGNGSSACNAAGWTKTTGVGGASWRILNYANPSDQPAVNNLILRLNSQLAFCPGSCSGLFVAPDATTGFIPAGARFVFFISAANNDTTTYSPDDLISFCNLCGAGPIYVVVASFPSGNSGLIANTGSSNRYISIGYDQGGSTGVIEIYSYMHQPPASSAAGNTYLHFIPQGSNAVNNTLTTNLTFTGCAIMDSLFYPLSLELTHFTAAIEKGTVLLKWQTSGSYQADYFEVQRSNNGNDFSTIGIVNVTDFADDHYYTFKDFHPSGERIFYRLKVKEHDGNINYSKVVAVQTIIIPDDIKVYPNPAVLQLTLDIPAREQTNALVKMLDMIGRVQQQYTILLEKGRNTKTIPIDHLTNGVYYIKVNVGGIEKILPFVKLEGF